MSLEICNLSFFDFLDDLFFVLDDNLKIIEINKSVLNKLGYNKNELIGEKITTFGDDFYKIKNFLNDPKGLDLKIKKKNKSEINLNAKLMLNNIRCLSKTVILLVAKDIDDILEKKELIENYKSLFIAIPDLVARVSKKGNIIFIKTGDNIGKDLDDIINKNIKELPVDEMILEEIQSNVEKVIETGESIELNYLSNIGDLKRYYYSKIVKNNDSEAIIIIKDITDEINIRRELLNSRDFAENLINTANVMVIGLDINGNVNIFNKTSEELTGYKKEEVINKNWFDDIPILLKKDINVVRGVFESLINEKSDNSNITENPIITKNGEIKYILWQNNRIIEDGNAIGTISFGLDISDRRKFEEEIIDAKNKAERSDKMKLEFLANMSHDLRTPMNSIIGFSDLLRSNSLSKEERHDYIDTIINNGKFLMALIDDIIDISKIDAGDLKIDNKDFEINKLMDELRNSYFKQAKDKSLEIIIDVDVNKNIIVNSDKYRLRQILMNLIGNAIKFTNDGFVKFGYKILNNHQLEIYVEDTGPGIERQYQKVIFNRFKQVQSKNKYKGAGLGLSISKSLIELLGFKDIKLISELNRGSKFYFIVPYKLKPYNYIQEHKFVKRDKKINLKNKSILIIEDNNDSMTIIKHYLIPTKANIIQLNDGMKLLETLKNNKIDLIILDIGLPHKDGYELLKEIREFDDRIPVIIESAMAMPDQKNKAFELGCDDFITKPFNSDDFLNKIDKLI